MPQGAARVSIGLGLVCLALALSRVPLTAGSDDKKLPKQPDRPFAVAVTASPRPTPSSEAETKAAKEVSDSMADLQEHIRNKRKAWFTLVTDPAEAEILLEIETLLLRLQPPGGFPPGTFLVLRKTDSSSLLRPNLGR